MGLLFRSHVYLFMVYHSISRYWGHMGWLYPLVAESPMRSMGLAKKSW